MFERTDKKWFGDANANRTKYTAYMPRSGAKLLDVFVSRHVIGQHYYENGSNIDVNVLRRKSKCHFKCYPECLYWRQNIKPLNLFYT